MNIGKTCKDSHVINHSSVLSAKNVSCNQKSTFMMNQISNSIETAIAFLALLVLQLQKQFAIAKAMLTIFTIAHVCDEHSKSRCNDTV